MYIYDMKKRSMQEPTFLILTALAAGPQHGYGIITDAERISGGVTRLQTGTLYMALDLWVPKTYATRRYSWMTPPARSCRRTRK
jgi:DNA-binding PadR family transcriptional regulator